MNKKTLGVGSACLAGVVLIAGLQVPSKIDDVDQKREDIIFRMNTILNEQHISLVNKNQCIITIFGKRHQLKAILTCDAIKVTEHNANITSEQDYVTQITDINTLSDGSLDTKDGCFIMEFSGHQIVGGPDCHIPEELMIPAQKGKPKLII